MENSYGIGVTNRYALFLDDDADPLEVLKVQEIEKESKKKTKVAEKENKVKNETQVKPKQAATTRKVIKDNQNVKPQQDKREEVKKNGPIRNTENRGERNVKFSGENREERNNRRNRDDKAFNGSAVEGARFNRDDRPARRNDAVAAPRPGNDSNETNDSSGGARSGRGGGSAGNRPRPPRGDGPRRNFENRGKREFDRQSGSPKTGVKPVDKRDGAGAHNWGSHKDDIDEMNKPIEVDSSWETDKQETTPNETKDEPSNPNETGVPTDPAAPTTTTTPAEEEVKELTLDEWKAQRAAGRQKPQYNLRKAGEGEDLTQWKKMYALNKKKEEEEEESEEEEYDASEYPQRVGRQKHVLDIEFRFSDSRRGGVAGSRPRGGPRGQRGGGGDRGGGGGGGGGGDRAPPERKERSVGKNFRNNEEPVDEGGANPRPEKGVGVTLRNNRQSAPKVDDEHDFPSLG